MNCDRIFLFQSNICQADEHISKRSARDPVRFYGTDRAVFGRLQKQPFTF